METSAKFVSGTTNAGSASGRTTSSTTTRVFTPDKSGQPVLISVMPEIGKQRLITRLAALPLSMFRKTVTISLILLQTINRDTRNLYSSAPWPRRAMRLPNFRRIAPRIGTTWHLDRACSQESGLTGPTSTCDASTPCGPKYPRSRRSLSIT